MNKDQINECAAIFRKFPEVKLAYAFGSQITGHAGPLSDYDFAVHFDNNDTTANFAVKTKLLDELSRLLKTDAIDIVVLDTTKGSELKYNIISQGKLLHSQEPYQLLVEPRIMNEYFDFKSVLKFAT